VAVDRFHELVAVPRLLGDHGEGEQAKLAIIEEPAAAAAAGSVALMAVMVPPVTAIRQVLGVSETTG
jgi:hypothetical protein